MRTLSLCFLVFLSLNVQAQNRFDFGISVGKSKTYITKKVWDYRLFSSLYFVATLQFDLHPNKETQFYPSFSLNLGGYDMNTSEVYDTSGKYIHNIRQVHTSSFIPRINYIPIKGEDLLILSMGLGISRDAYGSENRIFANEPGTWNIPVSLGLATRIGPISLGLSGYAPLIPLHSVYDEHSVYYGNKYNAFVIAFDIKVCLGKGSSLKDKD